MYDVHHNIYNNFPTLIDKKLKIFRVSKLKEEEKCSVLPAKI
jgi:hypothetical protein